MLDISPVNAKRLFLCICYDKDGNQRTWVLSVSEVTPAYIPDGAKIQDRHSNVPVKTDPKEVYIWEINRETKTMLDGVVVLNCADEDDNLVDMVEVFEDLESNDDHRLHTFDLTIKLFAEVYGDHGTPTVRPIHFA